MTLHGVLRRIARIVLLFFIVAVPLAFFFLSPDRLILHPNRDPLAHLGATRATVPFRGGELELWTARSRPHAVPGSRADVYVLRF